MLTGSQQQPGRRRDVPPAGLGLRAAGDHHAATTTGPLFEGRRRNRHAAQRPAPLPGSR
jgi:hypothetical protein